MIVPFLICTLLPVQCICHNVPQLSNVDCKSKTKPTPILLSILGIHLLKHGCTISWCNSRITKTTTNSNELFNIKHEMNCKHSSKLEKLFHLISSAQHKPTMLMSNGVNLIIVLTSSTCSSEKGPPYFSLPNSSREG